LGLFILRDRPKVLILGAGPAGLSCAVELLEQGGIDVEVVWMGHHLGGKASSWVAPDDHLVEHGWHMMLGFYQNLKQLMNRAGIQAEQTMLSMDGLSHVYNPTTGGLSTVLGKGKPLEVVRHFMRWDAFPAAERRNFNRFIRQAYQVALMPGADLTEHDDICFRTYAFQRGLRSHVMEHGMFRFFREAYFNYPESVSAYHVLQTLKFMSTQANSEQFVLAGGYSEILWHPIGRYIESMGGRLIPYQLATDLQWHERTITGVRLARPNDAQHQQGQAPWPEQVPQLSGSAYLKQDFDYLISTLPHDNLRQLNRNNSRMWQSPYFERLTRLRSVVTLSLTLVTRKPVGVFTGPVFGLPAPLGICTNMKKYWQPYASQPEVGAVLVFVGQESGFENWSDADIIERTIKNFSAIRGFGDIQNADIMYSEFHRNSSAHERLMLCEPGVQQFRPGSLTPFHNMFLAGDWVQNSVDLVCMEGAVTSGIEAAQMVLQRLRTDGVH
jgi:uncharacterized protein with NAD-binding domain and iron-sulfur cluster